MPNRYDRFFPQLLINEGGFSDNKNDPGGKTIYGITNRYFPIDYEAVAKDYFAGNFAQAKDTAYIFYKRNFYNPLYDSIQDEQLAFRLFDFGVNVNKDKAIEILQQSLGITNDGIFGVETLNSCNSKPNAYADYKSKLIAYYNDIVERNPNSAEFLGGWLRRLETTA